MEGPVFTILLRPDMRRDRDRFVVDCSYLVKSLRSMDSPMAL